MCGTLNNALSKLRRVRDGTQALCLSGSTTRISFAIIHTKTLPDEDEKIVQSCEQLEDLLQTVDIDPYPTEREKNDLQVASTCVLYVHIRDARSELDMLKQLKLTDVDLSNRAILYHVNCCLQMQSKRALVGRPFAKPVVALYDGSFHTILCNCTTAVGAIAAFRSVVAAPEMESDPLLPQMLMAVQRCIVAAHTIKSMLLVEIFEEFIFKVCTACTCRVSQQSDPNMHINLSLAHTTTTLSQAVQNVSESFLKRSLPFDHFRAERAMLTSSMKAATFLDGRHCCLLSLEWACRVRIAALPHEVRTRFYDTDRDLCERFNAFCCERGVKQAFTSTLPAVVVCAKRAVANVLRQAREAEKVERRAQKQRKRRAAKAVLANVVVAVAATCMVQAEIREGERTTEAEAPDKVIQPPMDDNDTAPGPRECLVCLEELSEARRALFLCCNTLFVCDSCSYECIERCPNCQADKPHILNGMRV